MCIRDRYMGDVQKLFQQKSESDSHTSHLSMAEVTDYANKVGKPPSEWTIQEVAELLRLIRLEAFIPAFQENSVRGDMLLELTEIELNELGMDKRLQRLNLLKAIEKLKALDQSMEKVAPPNFNALLEDLFHKVGKPIKDWTSDEVVEILKVLRLDVYKQAFINNAVRGDLFASLDDEMYMDLEIKKKADMDSIKNAVKLMNELSKRSNSSPKREPSAPTPRNTAALGPQRKIYDAPPSNDFELSIAVNPNAQFSEERKDDKTGESSLAKRFSQTGTGPSTNGSQPRTAWEEPRDRYESAGDKAVAKRGKPSLSPPPTKAVPRVNDDYDDNDGATMRKKKPKKRDLVVRYRSTNVEAVQTKLADRDYKIGRKKELNDIVLSDHDVSREHAKITHSGGVYYLTDVGSTSGTFVRRNSMQLKQGDLIEIGYSLIEITRIDGGGVSIFFIEACDGFQGLSRTLKANSRIGKRLQIEIPLPSDNNLSDIHATVEFDGNDRNYYLKSTRSNNYFWERLRKEGSSQGSQSKMIALEPNMVIRFGADASMEIEDVNAPNTSPLRHSPHVEDEEATLKPIKNPGVGSNTGLSIADSSGKPLKCMACNENPADAILNFCNHQSLCKNCARVEDRCPTCNANNRGFKQFENMLFRFHMCNECRRLMQVRAFYVYRFHKTSVY
eukprot:TRINITY_DN280_c0_g2_i3.p1 TRINITY_DN280_c0_g2~~TRINITY_DN280_c0_g2_i3.p1  ORF type:complete len:672 (-),score=81.56 TRINITY_DN280_c0_g2_i3:714-2729(-)